MGASYGISVGLIRTLAEPLSRLDIDRREWFDALGVDAETAPDTYVSGELVDHLLDEVAARRRDPTLGLTLARMAVVRPQGLFSHLIWLSGTVREAFTRAVRFYGVVSRRATLTLDERGPVATLYQDGVGRVSRGAILTEFSFATLVLRAMAATEGRFVLRAVRFAHASAHVDAYRELFGAPVTFRAPRAELELDSSQLDLRLASADPITSTTLEAKLAELTAGATGRSPFIDRVRRATAANLVTPSPATIARQLGISARTLRRHLEQEQTSLRTIVDEVRRERADDLLAAGTQVKEVAFGLGFSEPSAFSRAYKRWTGHPPKVGSGQSGSHE